MFHVLQDLSLERTRTILDVAAKTPGDKIGDFYASFMDEAAVDAKGARADQADARRDQGDQGQDRARRRDRASSSARASAASFGVGVSQDDKDPTTYIVSLGQGGLGLPDRDYYLKDDAKLATIRTAYQAYLAQHADARRRAQRRRPRRRRLRHSRTALATAHWTRIESRDADKTYNKWTAADFAAKAPGFPWAQYIDRDGRRRPAVLPRRAAERGHRRGQGCSPTRRSACCRTMLMLKVLRCLRAVSVERFRQDATSPSTAPRCRARREQQARWKRGVSTVSGAMGEAIGQQYVAKYFPPATKAAADELVKNVIAAMGDAASTTSTGWRPRPRPRRTPSSPPSPRRSAIPTSGAIIRRCRSSAAISSATSRAPTRSSIERDLTKLGQPIDRGEWFMTPMTINAYANPTMNEIVFPAAILQPPFFDPKADPAVNYGGIGAVIGHEISHHFDDQGRKYDLNGKLTDWWTPQDVARFKALHRRARRRSTTRTSRSPACTSRAS